MKIPETFGAAFVSTVLPVVVLWLHLCNSPRHFGTVAETQVADKIATALTLPDLQRIRPAVLTDPLQWDLAIVQLSDKLVARTVLVLVLEVETRVGRLEKVSVDTRSTYVKADLRLTAVFDFIVRGSDLDPYRLY